MLIIAGKPQIPPRTTSPAKASGARKKWEDEIGRKGLRRSRRGRDALQVQPTFDESDALDAAVAVILSEANDLLFQKRFSRVSVNPTSRVKQFLSEKSLRKKTAVDPCRI